MPMNKNVKEPFISIGWKVFSLFLIKNQTAIRNNTHTHTQLLIIMTYSIVSINFLVFLALCMMATRAIVHKSHHPTVAAIPAATAIPIATEQIQCLPGYHPQQGWCVLTR